MVQPAGFLMMAPPEIQNTVVGLAPKMGTTGRWLPNWQLWHTPLWADFPGGTMKTLPRLFSKACLRCAQYVTSKRGRLRVRNFSNFSRSDQARSPTSGNKVCPESICKYPTGIVEQFHHKRTMQVLWRHCMPRGDTTCRCRMHLQTLPHANPLST